MPDELLLKTPAEAAAQASKIQLIKNLENLQALLVIAYAISLTLSITVSGVLLAAGVLSWLITFIVKLSASKVDKSILSAMPPLALPLLSFAIAACLSGLANGGFVEGLRSFVSLRLFVAYFWAYTLFSRNRELTFKCVSALLIASAIAGLAATIEQLLNFHPFGYKWLQGTGFLGAPMAFAGQMQVFSFLALGFLFARSYRTLSYGIGSGISYAFIVTFNLLGLLFAAERSAWLGGIMASLAQGAFVSRKLLVKSLLALTLISTFSWFFIPVVHERLDPLINWQQDVSTRVRVYLWQQAYGLWQKSPVFGVGICRFPRFAISEAVVPGRSKDLNHAHSNYLQILSTTGLVGFLAFLWMNAAAFILALQRFFQGEDNDSLSDKRERALALGIAGGLVALLISGIFEYNFGTSQVRQAQWLTLGMLVRPRKQAANKKVEG